MRQVAWIPLFVRQSDGLLAFIMTLLALLLHLLNKKEITHYDPRCIPSALNVGQPKTINGPNTYLMYSSHF